MNSKIRFSNSTSNYSENELKDHPHTALHMNDMSKKYYANIFLNVPDSIAQVGNYIVYKIKDDKGEVIQPLMLKIVQVVYDIDYSLVNLWCLPISSGLDYFVPTINQLKEDSSFTLELK